MESSTSSTSSTAGTDTASATGAAESSLGAEIGSLLGVDFASEAPAPDESPASESSEVAADAPSAERQDAEAASPTAPEGTDTAERAGTPPADAAIAPALDAVVPSPTAPEPDPLASATPFTYTVNGESRPFDGIKVLGEHGAIIEPQALALVQRRLGERDHLFEANKAQYQQVQHLERLSTWTTRDAEGKETTVSGPEGLVAMREQLAVRDAAFTTLAAVFQDPQQFAALVDVDEAGNIVPNRAALETLILRADNAEMRARTSVAQQLQTLAAPPKPTAPPAAAEPTINFAEVAPTVVEQVIRSTGASSLTPKDREFLAAQLPRYVRTVTDADLRDNPTLPAGGKIVDATFAQVVKDRADLRAELASTAKATVSAATENAAKLAAAAMGTKVSPLAPTANRPAARPAVPAVPIPSSPTTLSDQDAKWELAERAAAGRSSR